MTKDTEKRLIRTLEFLKEPHGSTIATIVKAMNGDEPQLSLKKIVQTLKGCVENGLIQMTDGKIKLRNVDLPDTIPGEAKVLEKLGRSRISNTPMSNAKKGNKLSMQCRDGNSITNFVPMDEGEDGGEGNGNGGEEQKSPCPECPKCPKKKKKPKCPPKKPKCPPKKKKPKCPPPKKKKPKCPPPKKKKPKCPPKKPKIQPYCQKKKKKPAC